MPPTSHAAHRQAYQRLPLQPAKPSCSAAVHEAMHPACPPTHDTMHTAYPMTQCTLPAHLPRPLLRLCRRPVAVLPLPLDLLPGHLQTSSSGGGPRVSSCVACLLAQASTLMAEPPGKQSKQGSRQEVRLGHGCCGCSTSDVQAPNVHSVSLRQHVAGALEQAWASAPTCPIHVKHAHHTVNPRASPP